MSFCATKLYSFKLKKYFHHQLGLKQICSKIYKYLMDLSPVLTNRSSGHSQLEYLYL